MNDLNRAIAEVLQEISEYLVMHNVPFKPRAYEKVADTVLNFKEDITELYKKGGIKALEAIPGVGTSIAEKIEEFITTGRIKSHEELKKKTPVNLSESRSIEGLGPKSIKKLYDELGIKNLVGLEKAARSGKIGTLLGFGKKSEENILKGIEFVKKSGGRFVLGFMMPELRKIESRLAALPGVQIITIAARLADYVVVSNVDPYEDDPKQILEDIATVAENFYKSRGRNLFVIEDRREGIKKALTLAKKDDIVLITGKGSEQSIVIGGKHFSWDDRVVVREELKKRLASELSPGGTHTPA